MKSFILKIFIFLLIFNILNIYYTHNLFAAKKIINLSKNDRNYSCFLAGTIKNLENKPFENVKILSVVNNNGIINITEHEVLKDGKYLIEIPSEGFCNLIVSIDSVEKLTIPFFSISKKAYNLDMLLPTTLLPYIDFDDVKFSSKTPGLIEFLTDMKTAIFNINFSNLEIGKLKYSKDTNTFLQEINNYSNSIIELIYKNKNTQFSLYPLYVSYFNIASNYILLNRSDIIDTSIVNAFINKFSTNCKYLHTFTTKWETIAIKLKDNFENPFFVNLLNQDDANYSFLKCELLYQAMLFYFNIVKNEEKAYNYYEQLQKKYFDKPQAIMARDEYSPSKKIKIGNQLPDFSITSIDNKNITFSKNTFLGKYLLIHFWGLAEDKYIDDLRYISDAYDVFYDENFDILTIGFCETVDILNDFRKNVWSMKWHNGIEEQLFNGKIANLFEVKKLPFSILVAPDGRIVELGEKLSGRFLNNTLKKYFDKK